MIDRLLAIAAAEIGTKEVPPGSNNVKYNTEFYGKAVSGTQFSWCACFVGWCFDKAGILALTPFYKEGEKYRYNALNSAYCPNWVAAAKKLGQWVTSGYQHGDIVLFDWNGSGTASHIGIVESVTAERTLGGKVTLTTIEGNASDAVQRLQRVVDKTVLGAYRPKYAVEPATQDKSVQVKTALDKLTAAGVINSPGYWLANYTKLQYLDEFIIKMGARV